MSYNYSLTTFNPKGKLLQIDYAVNAVKNGSPAVGLRSVEGIVLAVENKSSPLYIKESLIEQITNNIGCIYSGIGPDGRVLVTKARKTAAEYELKYGEEIAPIQLVARLASVVQQYTQSYGVRPFGVSLLIGGWDSEKKEAMLFQVDPSGIYFPWKATAIGKNDTQAKTFLENRYTDEMGLEDGLHNSLLALRTTFEVAMTKDNIEMAVITAQGFRRLADQEVQDHIASIT